MTECHCVYCEYGEEMAEAAMADQAIAKSLEGKLCEGCPPSEFPDAPTRCLECPRRRNSYPIEDLGL